MLTGAQLAAAISAVLAGAVMLGWILHWFWARLSSAGSGRSRLAEMTDRLHEADRAREAADAARLSAESLLVEREVELQARLAELQAHLDGMVQDRDAELALMLHEARADADASMSELRSARRRIMELEAEVEALRR